MARGSTTNVPKQRAFRYIKVGSHVKILSPGIGENQFGNVELNRKGWVYIRLYSGILAKRRRKNVWLPPQPELFPKDSENRYLGIGDEVRVTNQVAYSYNTVGEVIGTYFTEYQTARVIVESQDGTRISINSTHVTLVPRIEARA